MPHNPDADFQVTDEREALLRNTAYHHWDCAYRNGGECTCRFYELLEPELAKEFAAALRLKERPGKADQ
jgi:hypothetical protein